jgi:hypothetical protein
MLVSSLYSSILKIEAQLLYETSLTSYQTTRRYIRTHKFLWDMFSFGEVTFEKKNQNHGQCLKKCSYLLRRNRSAEKFRHSSQGRPITVAGDVIAHSNTGIISSNPAQGMDVYVRLFCVCVVLCVGSSLATGLIPHPRSPTNCKVHNSRLILLGSRPEGLIRKLKG